MGYLYVHFGKSIAKCILFQFVAFIFIAPSLSLDEVFEVKFNKDRYTDDPTPILSVTIFRGPAEGHDADNETDTLVHPVSGVVNFLVKAPPDFGLMTIIKILRIPREADNCTTNFIQFEQNKGNQISPKICGTIERPSLFNFGSYPSIPAETKSFIDPSGQTRVYTRVADLYSTPYIAVKLLFTSYKECPQDMATSALGRCSTHQNFSCINHALFCDTQVNCGFDDEFGLDEANCVAQNTMRYGFLGAIAGLSVLYLIYVAVKKIRVKSQFERVTL